MINRRTTRFIGIFILLAISMLLIDNNWMGGTTGPVTISSKQVERSAGKNSRGHSTYFLTDSSNRIYKVSQWLYNKLHTGDRISVTRSAIFKKATRIQCYLDDTAVNENIGVVNDDWFGIGLCVIALLLSAAVIFVPRIFKNEAQLFMALYLSILLTVVIIAFYFIFSY